MSRITITLNDQMHSALKEMAARQRRSIGSIIEESLRLRGVQPRADVDAILEKARANAAVAKLSDEQAVDLAVAATREVRRRQ